MLFQWKHKSEINKERNEQKLPNNGLWISTGKGFAGIGVRLMISIEELNVSILS